MRENSRTGRGVIPGRKRGLQGDDTLAASHVGPLLHRHVGRMMDHVKNPLPYFWFPL